MVFFLHSYFFSWGCHLLFPHVVAVEEAAGLLIRHRL
jgi:hypothetical protein